MSLRRSYRLLAPLYDPFVDRASRAARRESLAALPREGRLDVLLSGIGTGLDLPHLPRHHRYTGVDLTRAMLRRAAARAAGLDLRLVEGDSQRLPFGAAVFDAAVLHLIVAVVPDPAACLRETARVLKPGGTVLLIDKFLRPGARAHVRRALNPVARRLATRLDVVFEEVMQAVPELRVAENAPLLLNGWFRRIRLEKR
ncbi:MAG: class I SAM-dependent methyltransferase [Pseudomonadota bacterium]